VAIDVMEYTKLGRTETKVSKIALGTMTFGEQTSQDDAFEILDYAIANGVSLIDTAEMYPIHPKRETYGRAEEIIGNYLSSRNNRDDVVIATKIASCNIQGIGASKLAWIRGGGSTLKYDADNVSASVRDSLRRLKTDYIDICQLHWPERKVPLSDRLDFEYDPDESKWTAFQEVLENLDTLVKEGLIRHVGVSNETPWGLLQYISIAEQKGLPRPVSTQNVYNLVNRAFDIGLSEIAIREQCGLLAYSPLAGGRLTGKYLANSRPDEARYSKWPGPKHRYHNQALDRAIAEHATVASDYGLKLNDMALAFVLNRPYVASMIVGAGKLDHIKNALNSLDIQLPDDLKSRLDLFHRSNPNPAITGIGGCNE